MWRSYVYEQIPCRPKPLPDELFSSWMLRLALSNGMKPQSFCQMMWPGRPFWNRSLDRSADPVLISSISVVTGVPQGRIRSALLSEFEGKLFHKLTRNGNTRWILPLAIFHRKHLRCGLSFCPECLAIGEPYYRRAWRLSLFTTCARHGCLLIDRCPRCGSPIQPHRIDMGNRNPYTNKAASICTTCEADLREAHSLPASGPLTLAEARHRLALDDGFIAGVPSVQYFLVLAQVLAILSTRARRAQPLRELVATNGNCRAMLSWRSEKISLNFDAMGTTDRAQFLEAAHWLMGEWPDRFVHSCKRANLRPSDILRGFPSAPKWYLHVAHSLSE